jgi:hypothetical protein
MRTTLTLDDDVAAVLKERAAEQGVSFKVLVNRVIRRGLGPAEHRSGPAPKTIPHHFGFRVGIALDRLNQLADQLEVEAGAGALQQGERR